MGEISYIELQRRYPGEYVATRGDEVVAHGLGIDKLFEQMDAKRIVGTEVLIQFVCSPDIIYVL